MAKTRREVLKNEDRHFILNPDQWPRWPWLPLKRSAREGQPPSAFNSLGYDNLGLLCADGFKEGFTIYHINIYSLPIPPEEFRAARKSHYATIDSLLVDGWMVD